MKQLSKKSDVKEINLVADKGLGGGGGEFNLFSNISIKGRRGYPRGSIPSFTAALSKLIIYAEENALLQGTNI